ncbi:hypothetical protein CP980_15545 [Streptomyces vinaceus]|uniref:Uncharacterized protein n=1 Tax=Streptomyces vinaceus TaxID=1960 RepID=A0A5J6J745_STRVI|nr:hypothetical protein [Streptomyces vinaceus]QEV46325.1 hypothetical protein CP980_15545 [Streptomyces vinaceus]GHE65787.1 hypothetical protein GCM10017778_58330 [Streptomyces vinaceus]
MTVYSRHASRGKTQILATYQEAGGGVVSSTVTSVGDAALAAPIIDALNRISALATVPVSIHDLRERGVGSYPTKHFAALTDPASRAGLLSGAHSLWYEYACLKLHQALIDLEGALAAVPEPIRIAIGAELETEARQLREALAEYEEGEDLPEVEDRRYWDFGHPFVTYDGGADVLSAETRERLNRLEEGITPEEREKAVADLRVLATAYERCSGVHGLLHFDYPEIFVEPGDSEGLYLSICAPNPSEAGADAWDIEIGRWEQDDPDEEYGSATGRTVLRCALPASPRAEEITGLLEQLGQDPELLAKWAESPVGSALPGTEFVVTGR